jgi:hypothetical protein
MYVVTDRRYLAKTDLVINGIRLKENRRKRAGTQ